MKQKIFFLAVLTVLLLLLAALPAGATLLTYNGSQAGFNDGHFYVGDDLGTLGASSITMWCVDSTHIITANQWDVTVVSLANPVGLAGLLGLTVNDYKAMFVLGQQFTNTSQVTDVSLQHIIWSFADPADYPLSVAQLALKNSALAAIGNQNWADKVVLVPTGNQSLWKGQVFEYQTPEPWTLGMVGVGMLGLGLIRFRHNRIQ